MSLQYRAIWFNLVLWSDERRTRRKPPPCQVYINQTHRYVHIFPVICRESFFFLCRVSLAQLLCLVLVGFNALKGRVIHGTHFWTATNVADGLNALTVCIEARVPFFPGSWILADEYADDLFVE